MIKKNKIFYKCIGFKSNKKYNKPIFYYHAPKCAGTTVVVLLSHLFKKTHRVNGSLFNKNDKGGLTAYKNFLKNENLINSNNLDFLYGHLPFEVHNRLNTNYLYMTTIREPIQRCISHYIWGIRRGYYSIEENIEDLFIENKLPKNAMVNQFSGVGLSHYNCDESVELSIKNLRDKINFVYDSKDVFRLLNLIISFYNFPNLFFQNQQVSYNKIELSEKKINIIKKYNKMDVKLYSELYKNKIINNNIINYRKRDKKIYLYSSPNLLFDNKKTLLLDEKKIKLLEEKLIKSDYNIQLV